MALFDSASNVSQFGANDNNVIRYKQAGEYAQDAKDYADLAALIYMNLQDADVQQQLGQLHDAIIEADKAATDAKTSAAQISADKATVATAVASVSGAVTDIATLKTSVSNITSDVTKIKDTRITPQMFGAVGDYIGDKKDPNYGKGTDCTKAFRDAINYAIAHHYQEVYVPAGAYLITDTINLGGVNAVSTQGVRLRGATFSTSHLIFKAPSNDAALISSIGVSGSHSSKGLENIALSSHPDTLYQGIGLLVKNTCFNHYKEMYIENFDAGIQLENAGDGGFTEFNYFQNMRLYMSNTNIKFVITKGTDGKDGDASFHGNNFDNIQNQIRSEATNPTPRTAGIGVQCIGVSGTATFLYHQYWQMQFFGGKNCIAFDLQRCDTKGVGGKITSEGWVEFKSDDKSSFDFNGVYTSLRDEEGPWIADSAPGVTPVTRTPGYHWNVPTDSVINLGRFQFSNVTSKQKIPFTNTDMPANTSPLPLPSSFADRGSNGNYPAIFHAHGASFESIGFATYNTPGNKFIFGDVAYQKSLTDFNPTFWFNHDGQSLTTTSSSWKILLDSNAANSTGGLIVEDNNIHPKTTAHTDLGQDTQRFKDGHFSGKVNINGHIALSRGNIPTSATSAGTAGQVAFDDNFIYFCTADNKWTKTPVGAW